MPVPSTAADLSTTAASNYPSGADAIGTALDDYLRSIQAIIKQQDSKGSDIASSTTIDIPSSGKYFVVTGTTAITTISDDWLGRTVFLKFSGILTLTHSSGLILPGSANITTADGDVAVFGNEATGVWRCVAYQRGDAGASNAGSFKNKIIGGDFTTNPWQRGTAFTALVSAAYGPDRFAASFSSDAVVDWLKTADAPTAAEAGVYATHCLHLDVTTADAAIAAGQYYFVHHKIEGLNAATFGFGQAGTRYVTLSFWHKHTKIGVYSVCVRNNAANRSYVAEYTQDVTDTWERASVTVPVDTSGTWLYDSGIGINLFFSLACGTTFQAAAGAWNAGNFLASPNQVNALDSTANNFKIDLIQLESGSAATGFDACSVGEVLSLCRRYTRIQAYYVPTTVAQNLGTIDMRATPTITGGGAGFTSTGTTADQLIAFQTGAAVQTLTLVSEL
jgi:hypothetical protein